MSTVDIGWLASDNGKKFAPKTLTTQVINAEGVSIEKTIDDMKNEYTELCKENKFTYFCTYDESWQNVKQIRIDNFKLNKGSQIVVQFAYGHLTSSPLYFSINGEKEFEVTYKGRSTSYMTFKEGSVYAFCFDSDLKWHLIGDIEKKYSLSDFGISVSSNEINSLSGVERNIQDQINDIKKENELAHEHNFQTDWKVVLTNPAHDLVDGGQNIHLPPDQMTKYGIVTMSGYTTTTQGSAVWLKVNGVEVGKLQQNTPGGSTNFYQCSFIVRQGDIVKGMASSQPVLTYYPIIFRSSEGDELE